MFLAKHFKKVSNILYKKQVKENLQKAKIPFKDYGHKIQTLDPNGIKLLIRE